MKQILTLTLAGLLIVCGTANGSTSPESSIGVAKARVEQCLMLIQEIEGVEIVNWCSPAVEDYEKVRMVVSVATSDGRTNDTKTQVRAITLEFGFGLLFSDELD